MKTNWDQFGEDLRTIRLAEVEHQRRERIRLAAENVRLRERLAEANDVIKELQAMIERAHP